MNVFSKIEQLVDLTESEKNLVAFIQQYPADFSKMKITEICEYCFISKSTLYRLCNKVGVEGLTALKLAVSSSMKEYKTTTNINYNFPFTPNQFGNEISTSLENVYNHTVKNTKNLLDVAVINQAVDTLIQADTITVYATAGNIFFAENFQFQMAEIGKNIMVFRDEYMQHLSAAKGTSSDVAIVISFEGRGRHIDTIFNLLKKTNTKVILITSIQNTYITLADDVIYMSSYENHYNKISSFSTRLSLLYVFDMLYAYYFQANFEDNITFKTDTYKKMSTK